MRDQKGFLVAVGILQMLTGAVFLIYFFSSFITNLTPSTFGQAAQVPKSEVYLELFTALGISFLFLGLGNGMILVRRWARTLNLLLIWAIFIMAFYLLVIVFLPGLASLNTINQLSPAMASEMKWGFLLFALFLLLIPAFMLVYLQTDSVIQTFERRDIFKSWTERCPLPLLGMSLFMGFKAFSLLFAIPQNFLHPFFGGFIQGWGGAFYYLIFSLLCAFLAFDIYHRNIRSWYITLGLIAFVILNLSITFLTGDSTPFYQYMDLEQDPIMVMNEVGSTNKATMLGLFYLLISPLIGFVLYSKRYFKEDNTPITPWF